MGLLLLLAAAGGVTYAAVEKNKADAAARAAAQAAAAAQALAEAQAAATSRHPRVLSGYTVRRHHQASYDASGNYRRS